MKTREELLELRNRLGERLATETHRIAGPHHEEQLDAVARVLAGIQAIDMVLENDLAPRDDGPPLGFFTSS